ncbi:MAG: hypothetical protein PUP91_29595 [Rhizonema sp. PD37]|nr:hypothetical protein [Rhizonema sp. PD37]
MKVRSKRLLRNNFINFTFLDIIKFFTTDLDVPIGTLKNIWRQAQLEDE